MLLVLIRSASPRHFNEYPLHIFLWQYKPNINTFQLKKTKHLHVIRSRDNLNNWEGLKDNAYVIVQIHVGIWPDPESD